MPSYIKQAVKVARNEGTRELFQRSRNLIGRKLTSKRIQKRDTQNNQTNLPVMVETAPEKIKWMTSFGRHEFPTKDSDIKASQTSFNYPIIGVIGGNWDKYKREWSSSSHHKSLVKHFEHGVKWEDTEIHKKKSSAINTDNYSTESQVEELNQRYRDIDRLYNSIKKKGYKPESELVKNPERNQMRQKSPSEIEIFGDKFPAECRVGIGRNGELIRIRAGKHRISIARILEVEKVPILVVVRHKQWQQLRNEVRDNGFSEEHDRELRNHPDLQNVLS